MPFAGYKTFKDCENKNRNKKDPSAYCGAIKHKVEKSFLKLLSKKDSNFIGQEIVNSIKKDLI